MSFGVPWTSYFIPGNASFNRFSISEIARCVMSMPIHSRFNFCAAWILVPQPQMALATDFGLFRKFDAAEVQNRISLDCFILWERWHFPRAIRNPFYQALAL